MQVPEGGLFVPRGTWGKRLLWALTYQELSWLQARPQDHPPHLSLSVHLSCAPPAAAKKVWTVSQEAFTGGTPERRPARAPVEVTPEATSTPLSPRVFFFLLPFRMLLRAGNQLCLRLIYTYLHHPRELHSVGGLS